NIVRHFQQEYRYIISLNTMIMMMLLIKSRETPNIIWVLSILSDLSAVPTWCRNDVGPEVLSRHGARTMSGWRCFPDMVQERCRYSHPKRGHKRIINHCITTSPSANVNE